MSLEYINSVTAKSLPCWSKIDDVIRGSVGIREGGENYMPKENSETQQS